MATLRFYFDDERAGPKFSRAVSRAGARVRRSARAAAQDAADQILTRGRADISSAGNFGTRWTQGLQAKVSEGGGNIRIAVTHSVSYFNVFQFGTVIHGKPMLWIPLDFAGDAQGVMARDFPGGLFRVDRKSGAAPLLLSISDKQPKYFGKEQVTIPKKFHVVEIIQSIARKMGALYRSKFKNDEG